MKTLLLIIISALTASFSFGQNTSPSKRTDNKHLKENEARFTTDTLRGNYIPKDLDDSFKQIDKFWNDGTKLVVKGWKEDEFSAKVHHGFGMWIRNNWQLWGGSRLSKFFNEQGITHPDDMSGIILTSYHRYLSNKEIGFNEQIKYYKDYWENTKKQGLKKTVEDFAEYHIGDTVDFNYNRGFSSKEQEKKYDDDVCIATGRILEKNEKEFLLKVLLMEGCDRKGIIQYDNENEMILNEKSKEWEKPKKRIIKYIQVGQSEWFKYSDWETR